MKKIIYLSTLLIIIFTNGKSQTSSFCFGSNVTYSSYSLTTNDNTRSMQSMDINNDGNMDLLYPSLNIIRYKLGLGTGLFSATVYTISTSGQTVERLAIADLNNDNNDDIILISTTQVYYIQNNTNGTFALPVVLPGVSKTYAINDFNSDGFNDFISVNSTTFRATINNANNTFSVAYSATLPSSATGIVSGDYNSDGNADALYKTNSQLFILNGTGTLSFTPVAAAVGTVSSTDFIFSDDYNNDNKDDYIQVPSGPNERSVIYKGLGTNNFIGSANFESGNILSGYDYRYLYFKDMNNDGYKDILVNSTNNDIISVLPGDATYSYQNTVRYQAINIPMELSINDFNNDGFLDVVCGGYSYNKYCLLVGGASGLAVSKIFKANKLFTEDESFNFTTGDINNDGYDDLVVVGDTLKVWQNNTAGDFNLVYVKKLNGSATMSPQSAKCVDLNNDGNNDILYPNATGANIGVLFGNGNGTFQTAVTIASTYEHDNITVSDVNNDGFLDVICNGSGGIKIFKNNAGASFSALSVPGTGSTIDFAVGDFNSDGFKDVCYSVTSNVIRLLTNNSGLNFSISTSSITLCSGSIIRTLAAIDYDKDGKDDIAAGHANCSAMVMKYASVYKRNGVNTFNAPGIYTLSNEPTDLIFMDVNFDAYPDLISTSPNDGSLNIMINNRAGGFAITLLKAVGVARYSYPGDFNNDGKDDLATIGGGMTSYISLLYNNSIKITPFANQQLCSGNSIVVKKTENYPGFYWAPSGSIADSIIISSAGTYSAISVGGVGQCSTYASFTVSMTPSPTLSVTGNTSICNGIGTALSANGAATYSWSTGASTFSISVSPSVTTIYSVTGTATNTCTKTETVSVSVSSNTLQVFINGNTNICSGNTASISATGADTYSWSTGESQPTILVMPGSTMVYSVTGTDLNNCTSTQTIQVTVIPSPSVTVNSGSICAGDSFTITAGGANTYTYSSGSDVVNPLSNITVTVTGTDVDGCIDNTGSVSTIIVNALPVVNVSGNDTICEGGNTVLYASGADSFLWNTGTNTSSISVTPSGNETYSVTGTTIAGCSAVQVTTIIVNALPNINAVSNNSVLCVGQLSILTATGATTYTWSTGENTASVSVSPTVTTAYTVNGTDANNCINNAVITQSVSTCTGIQEQDNINSLVIFPNPANNIITINSSYEFEKVELINVTGQLLLSENMHTDKYTLKSGHLENGVYFVKISYSSGVYTTKIIVNH